MVDCDLNCVAIHWKATFEQKCDKGEQPSGADIWGKGSQGEDSKFPNIGSGLSVDKGQSGGQSSWSKMSKGRG